MILVINCGSSTLKFRLYDTELKELASGIAERVGLRRSFVDFRFGKEKTRRNFAGGLSDHRAALGEVFALLEEFGVEKREIVACGHRVVHGGTEFVEPTLLTKNAVERLHRYSRLAPLHNPPAVSGIEAASELLPRAAQAAMFDTSFHATIPAHAHTYAVPHRWTEKYGLRKYGFHGISHRYVTEEAARRLKKPLDRINLVTCHLGSGASVTAVERGRSVDTSMGFTPLAGVMMSTRSGDIDPAIPLHLTMTEGLEAEDVTDVLNRESGLRGVSGHADLRNVLALLGHDIPGFTPKRRPTKEELERARLAFDMLTYSVARYVGSYVALLGRVDAVVFTAGVGERSAPVRRGVMARIKLRPKPKALVIPTNEELMIARETRRLAGV
ncbi:acetate/propionate family kinase [Patescibacteria group bacterium]